MLKLKIPKKIIAETLNVHISTVYREIKKGEYLYLNGSTWIEEKRYSCDIADRKYRENLKNKGADIKLGKDFDYAEYIERRIVDDKLTPGAVLGEIKRNGLSFDTSISINPSHPKRRCFKQILQFDTFYFTYLRWFNTVTISCHYISNKVF